MQLDIPEKCDSFLSNESKQTGRYYCNGVEPEFLFDHWTSGFFNNTFTHDEIDFDQIEPTLKYIYLILV